VSCEDPCYSLYGASTRRVACDLRFAEESGCPLVLVDAALRQWAAEWESDIRRRLAAGETGPTGVPDSNWDAYLDER
jgi:hypothetical protein